METTHGSSQAPCGRLLFILSFLFFPLEKLRPKKTNVRGQIVCESLPCELNKYNMFNTYI